VAKTLQSVLTFENDESFYKAQAEKTLSVTAPHMILNPASLLKVITEQRQILEQFPYFEAQYPKSSQFQRDGRTQCPCHYPDACLAVRTALLSYGPDQSCMTLQPKAVGCKNAESLSMFAMGAGREWMNLEWLGCGSLRYVWTGDRTLVVVDFILVDKVFDLINYEAMVRRFHSIESEDDMNGTLFKDSPELEQRIWRVHVPAGSVVYIPAGSLVFEKNNPQLTLPWTPLLDHQCEGPRDLCRRHRHR
jgi:hypothetical protein